MTIDNIFKYTVDGGLTGGIVIASSIDDARERIRSYYASRGEDKNIVICELCEDVDDLICGVYEIYNEVDIFSLLR